MAAHIGRRRIKRALDAAPRCAACCRCCRAAPRPGAAPAGALRPCTALTPRSLRAQLAALPAPSASTYPSCLLPGPTPMANTTWMASASTPLKCSSSRQALLLTIQHAHGPALVLRALPLALPCACTTDGCCRPVPRRSRSACCRTTGRSRCRQRSTRSGWRRRWALPGAGLHAAWGLMAWETGGRGTGAGQQRCPLPACGVRSSLTGNCTHG